MSNTRSIAKNLYALIKTDGLMMCESDTDNLRCFTEHEFYHLYAKDAGIITEGKTYKKAYAMYLESVKHYHGKLLTEAMCVSLRNRNINRSMLTEMATKGMLK